jgi:5,5'-dehydrodivanillate O-demethylase
MSSVTVERRETTPRAARPRVRVSERDLGQTGPGTVAGRYLRSFWQPIFHADELRGGRPRLVRVMSEDYVLYRGQDGVARLSQPRCPHRGMLLSAGSVEGDALRCFYHGWKFAGDGRCVEQPPEPKPFCEKIALRTYPTRETLGLVFAYLGEGEPPAFPDIPSFEEDGLFTHTDSYVRPASFFNNLENLLDTSHLAYAHAHVTETWDNYTDGPEISVSDTSWGLQVSAVRRRSGKRLVAYFGMPNMAHAKGPRNDPEVDFREFRAWWVPIDDDRHTQFTVVAVRGKSREQFERYLARQVELRRQRDLDREALTRAVLTGEVRIDDLDPSRVHILFLQDDVAQAGCGLIHERPPEHLGRGDVGVIAVRKLWLRELRAFASGEPLTEWKYDPTFEPLGEF